MVTTIPLISYAFSKVPLSRWAFYFIPQIIIHPLSTWLAMTKSICDF